MALPFIRKGAGLWQRGYNYPHKIIKDSTAHLMQVVWRNPFLLLIFHFSIKIFRRDTEALFYVLSRAIVLSVLDLYKQPVQNLAQLVLLLGGKLSGQRISVYIGAEVNKKAEGGCVVCWHMRITRPQDAE